ncbi:MAG: hemolysin III family protein [Anaerolineales bacterium]|nr:hemolysin III family protein [Anaerolineales bacterium]MCA9928150.1 hemolysin III family protein [Anaerolineales bacterium]
MRPPEIFKFTIEEEIWNGITHGIGAGLSIAGLTVLVLLAAMNGDSWRVVSFSIYGSTLVLLYLASTLYHSIQIPKVKQILRRFDHAAIYLLIAGTYTPFLLVNLRGRLGWTLLAVVWGIALVGIVFRTIFFGRFEVLATIGYVLMGWLIVVAFKEMLLVIPPGGIALIIAGGLTYTVGVIFYAWKKLPYNHAIWHLFVLGGSICHYFAMLFHVLPTSA